MVIKYDIDIDPKSIERNLSRILNQTYKLLPNREENIDWEKPLSTILEELGGMDRLLENQSDIFFSLVSKLEGLFLLTKEEDFLLFRRTIFDCLNLINIIKNNIIDKEI